MIHKSYPLLALSVALAGAADPPPSAPFETVLTGNFSHASNFHRDAVVLNWNIDRGEHLDRVLAAIRETKADLCILQEVDLGARRTEGKDIAKVLAEEAGMNYAFAPEFRELSQSTANGPAYHGQATLTTLPVRSARVLRFTHQSGFWKPRPLLLSALPIMQRREGGRIALISELRDGDRPLVVYNLHLESRADEQFRLLQLNEVLADAERYPSQTPIIIAGDFNTMSRFSPVIPRLRDAGYRSAFGDRHVRTHVIFGALDWVFVRGNVDFESPRVLRGLHASDHDAISVALRF